MSERLTVWVLQTGEYLPVIHPDQRPMRAANVTRALREAGHEVILWTADWSHQDGAHVFGTNTKLRVDDSFEIRFVHSRGYKRNVGPGRLLDHAQLGRGLARLLRHEQPPDVAFVGFPPIEPAAVMVSWLGRRGVPCLVDVKDQWPDVLLRPFPRAAQWPARVALAPYYALAGRAIGGATGVVSMTDEFLDWSVGVAGRRRGDQDLVVPLTAPAPDLDQVRLDQTGVWWDERGVPDDGRLRAVYVGSLSTHLTRHTISQAARDSEWQFVLCGTGSAEEEVRHDLGHLPNVVMPGWVDHAQAEVLYRRATVGVAPYLAEEGFRISIPNKFLDAFRNGLPMVSSVIGTTERILRENSAGITYQPSDADGLRAGLSQLANDAGLTRQMGDNARRLYERQFTYEKSYGALVQHLVGLAQQGTRGGSMVAQAIELKGCESK